MPYISQDCNLSKALSSSVTISCSSSDSPIGCTELVLSQLFWIYSCFCSTQAIHRGVFSQCHCRQWNILTLVMPTGLKENITNSLPL